MKPDSLDWQALVFDAYNGAKEMGGDIILAFKDAAPWAWEIAQRQVYAEAITNMWVVVFLIPLFWTKKSHRTYREICEERGARYSNNEEDLQIGIMVFSVLAGTLGVVLTMCLGTDLIRVLINPDYYTIKLIAEMVGAL